MTSSIVEILGRMYFRNFLASFVSQILKNRKCW